MRKPFLLLLSAALLAVGLACSSSSSHSASSGGPTPFGTDYTAFVKQQVVTQPDHTEPADVSQTTFTDYNYDNPDAFDDVLGIPSATIQNRWATVR